MSTAQHSTAPDTALLSHPGRPHKTPIAYINEAVHYNPNMGAINQPNIFSSEKEPGYVGGWTEYEYVREGAEMRLTPKLRALPPSPPPSSVSPPPTPVSYAENLDPEGEDGGPSRYNFDSFGKHLPHSSPPALPFFCSLLIHTFS